MLALSVAVFWLITPNIHTQTVAWRSTLRRRLVLFFFPGSLVEMSHTWQTMCLILAVSLPQAWRERTDTNCLTDLHTVFMWPATVLLEGPVFERKNAHTFNKQDSKIYCGVDRAEEDTFCLLAAVKGKSHTHCDDADSVPI